MLFFLFLIANLFPSLFSYGYFCQDELDINPPVDITQPYYYPETWNETQVPPVFNASQSCTWQILIPEGMYATVEFYKYADTPYLYFIGVHYPNGWSYELVDHDTAPYVFTSPYFWIEFQTVTTEPHFAFKVVWSYYPQTICKQEIMLTSSDLIPSTATPCATTITAHEAVRLVAFEPHVLPISSLRLWLIFEGDSINNRYIGNLYDAYSTSYANFYKWGKQVTIYKFNEMSPQYNHTLFVGMDVQAAGNVRFFRGLVCSPYCQVNLDSTYSVNSLITVSDNVYYLGKFKHFPTDSNLKIYGGQINDDHLSTTINSSNVLHTLPTAVKSAVKIYVLDKQKINMYLDTNPEEVSYSLVYVGRQINIRSFDVGHTSLQQDTFENFTTGDVYTLVNFNFNVTYFDLSGPATTLQITVFRAGNEVFHGKYYQGNSPPSTIIKVLGDSMTVNYCTYGAATKGFRVDVLCTEDDETSTIAPVKKSTTSALTTADTKQSSSSTKLATEKYETTTKGSNRTLSKFLLLFVGIFSILFIRML